MHCVLRVWVNVTKMFWFFSFSGKKAVKDSKYPNTSLIMLYNQGGQYGYVNTCAQLIYTYISYSICWII